MHRLLKRQLKRIGLANEPVSNEMQRLIDLVGQAYSDYDEAHTILERSLDISLKELNDRNHYLQMVLQAIPDSYLLISESLYINDFRITSELKNVFRQVEVDSVMSNNILIQHSENLILLVKQVVRTGDSQDTVIRIVNDELSVFVEVRCRRIDKLSLLLTFRDVTDHFVAEQLRAQALIQSQRSQRQLQDVIDAAPVGIVILDMNYRITLVNQYAANRLGRSEQELVGIPALQLLISQHRAKYFEQLQNLSDGKSACSLDVSMRALSEVGFMVSLSLSKVMFDNKEQIIQTFTDITDRIAMEGQLRIMATTDPLTGIYNRRSFDEKMSVFLADQHHACAIIMMDLDHFKQVNDNYGHSVGDNVIVAAVNVVLKELRSQDLFGRYGGEEFIVGLPDTSHISATRIAERLRAAIEGHAIAVGENQSVNITASFGVSSTEQGVMRLEPLILVADKNLYLAKNQGRNRVVALHSNEVVRKLNP
ncbi:sensor domain-containing diguanylate cyclase [Thaumasiovibrio subtropicus]|uniref:sensor domain-containing diguanylate cyclase n=1 Tax=Thaumasiovibrio subtropicus TaxID=1891207 RepID=UPI000B362DDF|nr:GGDEF domain-containing protein [Thaumasiovibrio subtropicus]